MVMTFVPSMLSLNTRAWALSISVRRIEFRWGGLRSCCTLMARKASLSSIKYVNMWIPLNRCSAKCSCTQAWRHEFHLDDESEQFSFIGAMANIGAVSLATEGLIYSRL
jgi:hypothetical protein